MDIKTLSTIIGHVFTATTLNVYAHVTDGMKEQVARIDQGIGEAELSTGIARQPIHRKKFAQAFQNLMHYKQKSSRWCHLRPATALPPSDIFIFCYISPAGFGVPSDPSAADPPLYIVPISVPAHLGRGIVSPADKMLLGQS